ncbi:SMR family transporter [Rhodoferax sp.]|uniref:SMR family transporter n=1 Tax=Rhodoferax sp. TaxID=50421 RepID=UPI0025E706D4|nr:SMR family transporter [Rhodoferax sp.]
MTVSSASYIYLFIAIVAEVVATSFLKSSESFTRLWPSMVTVVGYAIAFLFLSLTLRTIPTGVAYAIWSGTGIVLISLVSWWWFGQSLDLPAIAGMGLIIAGVVVVNVFSKTTGH